MLRSFLLEALGENVSPPETDKSILPRRMARWPEMARRPSHEVFIKTADVIDDVKKLYFGLQDFFDN